MNYESLICCSLVWKYIFFKTL